MKRSLQPVWRVAAQPILLTLLLCATFTHAATQQILESSISTNGSLLWGPYRPNLYFGVRPRLPNSLLSGLLWAKVDSFATAQTNFRHTCEQHEGMAGYGWEEYDIRNGGRQVIHDAGNNLDLTIEFVKVPGGSHGGGWAARISGTPREDAPEHLITTMVFYAGMEGLGELTVTNEHDDLGQEGSVTLSGQSPGLGEFKIDIVDGPECSHPMRTHKEWDTKPLDRTIVSSMQVPAASIWQAKGIIFNNMKTEIDALVAEYGQENMPPPWHAFTVSNDIKDGNFHVIQKVFQGSFSFDLLYSATDVSQTMTPDLLTEEIARTSASFKSKFSAVLAPNPPFTSAEYTTFSQHMLSNLVGGIGYFYGDSIVDRSYAVEYEEENEGFWEETAEARARNQLSKDPAAELFTSIPSRPFFPRGFLWDEGFHLIPVVEWDIDLTLQIVQSWFSLMDEDGWIAREQILGEEARSKVPQEFQVQYPHYANPPTLFMILESLVEKLNLKATSTEDATNIRTRLAAIYPLLKRQYFWFRKTQSGDIKSYDREAFSSKEAYRWRGRTPRHILTSGLDDYPRPQPPHPGELHIDLISWMGMMTRSLHHVANALAQSDDAAEFKGYLTAITRNIDDLHWSTKDSAYCDATIDDYEESYHVCHKGYISLFPLMTGLLPPSHPNLKPVLDLLSDPEELWSPYGIRSLSLKDPLYSTDENYWRSPIWVNMNYLILKNVLVIAQSPGPCQEQARKIYTDLRINLVKTVFTSWQRTGFAWEQYNPETGEGQRTQHFTGWTSLVVSIMRMPDISGGHGTVKHGEL
jgi:mannosyl-oligosaccharide glucosidase